MTKSCTTLTTSTTLVSYCCRYFLAYGCCYIYETYMGVQDYVPVQKERKMNMGESKKKTRKSKV